MSGRRIRWDAWIASSGHSAAPEATKPKVRVPGQALRQQRAEPGPSPVEDATGKIPDNRCAVSGSPEDGI